MTHIYHQLRNLPSETLELIDALEVHEVFGTHEAFRYDGHGIYTGITHPDFHPSYTWQVGSLKSRRFFDSADEARAHAFIFADLVSLIDLDGTADMSNDGRTCYALCDSWGHFAIDDSALLQLYYIDDSDKRHAVLERACEAVELDSRIMVTRSDVRFSAEALAWEVRA